MCFLFLFQLFRLTDLTALTFIKSVVLSSKIACGLTNLFFYCYFGKYASENFSKISDCLYETDWQRLPVKLQKYFIIMITNTQKLVFYHGFGMVYLNLETFCKVCNILLVHFIRIILRNLSFYRWFRQFSRTTWYSKLLQKRLGLHKSWFFCDFSFI